MGERTRQAVEVIGDVAKKAKDAVMVPFNGAYALAKAVVGEEEQEPRTRRPRGDEPSTKTRTDDSDTTPETSDSPAPDTASTSATETAETTSAESTSSSDASESTSESEASLEDVWGVGASRAEDLRDAGFESVRDVADATTDELSEVSGIGASTAEKMVDSADDLV